MNASGLACDRPTGTTSNDLLDFPPDPGSHHGTNPALTVDADVGAGGESRILLLRSVGGVIHERSDTHMSTETTMTKKAIYDKIESQINSVQAKIETLKAKAETTKANTEQLAAIAELFTKKVAIDKKLVALKLLTDVAYQHAKTDVEQRVADLEESVQAIEAKFKAA